MLAAIERSSKVPSVEAAVNPGSIELRADCCPAL
jgi:hypothetical protein